MAKNQAETELVATERITRTMAQPRSDEAVIESANAKALGEALRAYIARDKMFFELLFDQLRYSQDEVRRLQEREVRQARASAEIEVEKMAIKAQVDGSVRQAEQTQQLLDMAMEIGPEVLRSLIVKRGE